MSAKLENLNLFFGRNMLGIVDVEKGIDFALLVDEAPEVLKLVEVEEGHPLFLVVGDVAAVGEEDVEDDEAAGAVLEGEDAGHLVVDVAADDGQGGRELLVLDGLVDHEPALGLPADVADVQEVPGPVRAPVGLAHLVDDRAVLGGQHRLHQQLPHLPVVRLVQQRVRQQRGRLPRAYVLQRHEQLVVVLVLQAHEQPVVLLQLDRLEADLVRQVVEVEQRQQLVYQVRLYLLQAHPLLPL
jgi:hypothetical protein